MEKKEYIEDEKRAFVVGIVNGIVDRWSGEEATLFTLARLVGQEQNRFIGVPVLVEVSVLLVLEQEQFRLLFHILSLIYVYVPKIKFNFHTIKVFRILNSQN